MEIVTFPLGALQTNCYLLIKDKEALAIDVGGDPKAMLDLLEERGVTLKNIFLTHLHFDHTMGVQALHEATNAPIFANEDDRWMLDDEFGTGGMWGLPKVPEYSFSPLVEGKIPLFGTECVIMKTPGHTPGSLCFYFPEFAAVFVGDVLFYRSIGRTDFPRGESETLLTSITKSLLPLPDATAVYPGHGQATSIGGERNHNPFLQ